MKHVLSAFALLLLLTPLAVHAQEETTTPVTPAAPAAAVSTPDQAEMPPATVSPFSGLSPALLQRMRADLNRELRLNQQMLGTIDPQDAQLRQMLQTQQSDIVAQLKDISAQLTASGWPTAADPGLPPGIDGTVPGLPPGVEGVVPPRPVRVPPQGLQDALDPMYGVTNEQTDMLVPPNLRRPIAQPAVPRTLGADPLSAPTPDQFGAVPPGRFVHADDLGAAGETPGAAATDWGVQPSKEVVALRSTVETLQKEVAAMRQDIKALETQIRLLNQNLLLQSQQGGAQQGRTAQ